jgi:hypothetical protein
VWAVRAGENLLAGSRPRVDRAERYNSVVAFNSDDPNVWAAAYVTTGPTRWDGPYGQRPAYYASTFLTAGNVGQAAATRLASINGKVRKLEVECVKNPALEPGDMVDLTWPDGSSEQMLVRRIEMGLQPGPMKLVGQGAV